MWVKVVFNYLSKVQYAKKILPLITFIFSQLKINNYRCINISLTLIFKSASQILTNFLVMYRPKTKPSIVFEFLHPPG